MSFKIHYFALTILNILFSVCLGQRTPIKDALYLGNHTLAEESGSLMDANCVWRRGADRDLCPDPDVIYTLYTPGEDDQFVKEKVNLKESDWLRGTNWNSVLEPIIIIHGYGDSDGPIFVLRDAYLSTKKYSVLMVDWGALCKPPCYVAAVHNLRPVAKCISEALVILRGQGYSATTATCVGHSLGAHICGIMSNYLPFRLHRIIGLDPARPLIRNGPPLRLDAGDAHWVQVLHTNAGKYGEGGRMGHLDVCINGGRSQPFCESTPNEALCSHLWVLCYQAQSLFSAQMAEPCSRRCPSGPRPTLALSGSPVRIGQYAPEMAYGTYCLHTDVPPFCPATNNGIGDDRCCLKEETLKDHPRTPIKTSLEVLRQVRKRKLRGKF